MYENIFYKEKDEKKATKRITDMTHSYWGSARNLKEFIENNSIGFNGYSLTISPVSASYIDEKSKEEKILTIFSKYLSKEELKNIPAYLENAISQTKVMNEKRGYTSFLISYYFERGEYTKIFSAVENLVKQLDEDSKNELSFENQNYLYYSLAEAGKLRAKVIIIESYLVSLGLIKKINRYSFAEYSVIISENPEVLDNKQLLYYHQKIMKKSKKFTNKGIRTNDFDFMGSDAFNGNPSLLENILDRITNTRLSTWYGDRNIFDNYDFKGLKRKPSEEHKEMLIKILKNYFYSKYGKGSKYLKLESRLLSAKRLLNDYGYKDFTTLELIDGLPDKIKAAALKGELGD